jgi:hypothetical protein
MNFAFILDMSGTSSQLIGTAVSMNIRDAYSLTASATKNKWLRMELAWHLVLPQQSSFTTLKDWANLRSADGPVALHS